MRKMEKDLLQDNQTLLLTTLFQLLFNDAQFNII